MAASTGPIVAVGAIAWANQVIIAPRKPDDVLAASTRIAVGTGVAAASLALVERANEKLAVGIAWLAMVAVVFTRIGGQRAPAENLLGWFQTSQ